MRLGIWLLAATLCACGGGSVRSVEGTWQATDQAAGSALSLSLNEEQGRVAGSGTYAIESGPSGRLLVTGSMQSGANVHLYWTYDMGDRAEYVATLSDDNHMSGTLTTQSGSTTQTQALVFVRE
jgi:hypothetical protein